MGDEDEIFNLAIDVNPADWSLRLVYADWLEERGRIDESKLQRWLTTNQKHPQPPNTPRYANYYKLLKISHYANYHKFWNWYTYNEFINPNDGLTIYRRK